MRCLINRVLPGKHLAKDVPNLVEGFAFEFICFVVSEGKSSSERQNLNGTHRLPAADRVKEREDKKLLREDIESALKTLGLEHFLEKGSEEYQLPFWSVKKIAKTVPEVGVVSKESVEFLIVCCERFITHLTRGAGKSTRRLRRLRRVHFVSAIGQNSMYDFLIVIFPEAETEARRERVSREEGCVEL